MTYSTPTSIWLLDPTYHIAYVKTVDGLKAILIPIEDVHDNTCALEIISKTADKTEVSLPAAPQGLLVEPVDLIKKTTVVELSSKAELDSLEQIK